MEGLGSPGVLSPAAKSAGGSAFQEILTKVKQVDNLQKEAQAKAEQLALGQDVEIHQVMIAAEKASLALDLTIAIRNKLLDAYQELMRMQI